MGGNDVTWSLQSSSYQGLEEDIENQRSQNLEIALRSTFLVPQGATPALSNNECNTE